MQPDAAMCEAGAKLGRNDEGLALRLVHYAGDEIRYDKHADQWYRWDGRRHLMTTEADMVALARRVVGHIYAEAATLPDEAPEGGGASPRRAHASFANASHSERAIRATVSLARSDPRIWRARTEFDTDPYLLNFLNCTVDARTLKWHEHRREDHITKLIPHSWNPSAEAPMYDALMARCFQDGSARDAALLPFVRQVFGYTILGANPGHYIIFIGEDQNCGKTVVIEIPYRVLGDDYAHKSKPDLIARKRLGHHDSEIASIAGRHYIYMSETSSQFSLDEQRVKELTGDSNITVRRLYAATERNQRVTFTLVLAVNSFPHVAEWDEAIRRRIVCLPAGPPLPESEIDITLAERIVRDEAEGVLARLVIGAHEWYRDWQAREDQGAARTAFVLPPSVDQVTAAYAKDQDHIARFIDDCIVLRPDSQVPATHIYNTYKKWRGPGEPGGRRVLYARLRRLQGVSHDGRLFTGVEVRQPDWQQLQAMARGDVDGAP